MFTGIVTDIGELAEKEPLNEGLRIKILSHYDIDTIDIGASIACSGICLTVVEKSRSGANKNSFTVEAWEEALRLTNISRWKIGGHINLERSLKLGDEMGGHLVSGHVDGLAEIMEIKEEGDARRFQLKAPREFSPFIARKGSVALDGTSLTINSVDGDLFDILIIRHTLEVTTWGERKKGDCVNLEIDQLARYAARLSEFRH